MIDISQELVEEKIAEVIKEIADTLEIEVSIDSASCPGLLPGITSQVLVTVMGRLEKKLDVLIPDDCYIFYDKKEQKQLDIKMSAEKLIKHAKYGK
jgi:acyl carrier protein